LSRLLLLCPLVTSIASLSTCHVYCFSVHLSQEDREAIDVTSGQRSNRRDMWTEKQYTSTCHVYCFSVHMSHLLLLCPLVMSITSLSTCHVYCFSVHLSRLLLLCPLVMSIASLSTGHVYYFSVHLSREAIDVTSGQRSNRRDKWREK
jgi:hypothetical protein